MSFLFFTNKVMLKYNPNNSGNIDLKDIGRSVAELNEKNEHLTDPVRDRRTKIEHDIFMNVFIHRNDPVDPDYEYDYYER
jgi:hypothetical protein